ncbi:MAG: LPS export ABC transporter periplasmic protein LptC [Sphingomonadales bacterium]
MSELATRDRLRKQHWAAPGGMHDIFVHALKIALPALVGLLLAYLAMAPLARRQEISFILDKTKVDVAKERMKVQAAEYRGQDSKGRPFRIAARSAIQATSRDPIVDIQGMTAQILLDDGPASLRADRSRYNIDSEQVTVIGPIIFAAPDDYRLVTHDVTVDLNQRTLQSRGPVTGTMRLGDFSADRLSATLADRRVTLNGNARLHIIQGGIR